jgi:hypothetical protein
MTLHYDKWKLILNLSTRHSLLDTRNVHTKHNTDNMLFYCQNKATKNTGHHIYFTMF